MEKVLDGIVQRLKNAIQTSGILTPKQHSIDVGRLWFLCSCIDIARWRSLSAMLREKKDKKYAFRCGIEWVLIPAGKPSEPPEDLSGFLLDFYCDGNIEEVAGDIEKDLRDLWARASELPESTKVLEVPTLYADQRSKDRRVYPIGATR